MLNGGADMTAVVKISRRRRWQVETLCRLPRKRGTSRQQNRSQSSCWLSGCGQSNTPQRALLVQRVLRLTPISTNSLLHWMLECNPRFDSKTPWSTPWQRRNRRQSYFPGRGLSMFALPCSMWCRLLSTPRPIREAGRPIAPTHGCD